MLLLIFSPLPNFARAIFLYVVFCWIAAALSLTGGGQATGGKAVRSLRGIGSGVGKIAPVGLRCGRSPTGSITERVAQSATPHRKRPRWRFASLPSSPLSASLSPSRSPCCRLCRRRRLGSPSPACVCVICEHTRNSGRAGGVWRLSFRSLSGGGRGRFSLRCVGKIWQGAWWRFFSALLFSVLFYFCVSLALLVFCVFSIFIYIFTTIYKKYRRYRAFQGIKSLQKINYLFFYLYYSIFWAFPLWAVPLCGAGGCPALWVAVPALLSVARRRRLGVRPPLLAAAGCSAAAANRAGWRRSAVFFCPPSGGGGCFCFIKIVSASLSRASPSAHPLTHKSL